MDGIKLFGLIILVIVFTAIITTGIVKYILEKKESGETVTLASILQNNLDNIITIIKDAIVIYELNPDDFDSEDEYLDAVLDDSIDNVIKFFYTDLGLDEDLYGTILSEDNVRAALKALYTTYSTLILTEANEDLAAAGKTLITIEDDSTKDTAEDDSTTTEE